MSERVRAAHEKNGKISFGAAAIEMKISEDKSYNEHEKYHTLCAAIYLSMNAVQCFTFRWQQFDSAWNMQRKQKKTTTTEQQQRRMFM